MDNISNGIGGKTMHKEDKLILKKIEIKQIIDYIRNKKIIIPDFQRELQHDKIQEIINKFIQKHISGENYFIAHGYTLCICKIGDKYYLIDGQHRLKSMEILYKQGYKIDIIIRIKCCDNIEQVKEDFRLLNMNSDIPLLYTQFKNDFVQSMLISIKDTLKKEYNKSFNKNKTQNSRSNRLHIDDFINLFDISLIEKSNYDKDTLLDKLLEINDEISIRIQLYDNINHYINNTDLKSIDQTGFFLTLSNISWIDKIYNDEIEIDIKPINYKKAKIPACLRKKVFNRDWGKVSNIGECFVCTKMLDRDIAQMGHVIAEHMGGPTNEENLKPICSTCNQSMGTQNMLDFKITYFNG
tara:strand:- start:765 stop:1826 length:1062 start_codon:yes stop_codon:yes gene_type:complete